MVVIVEVVDLPEQWLSVAVLAIRSTWSTLRHLGGGGLRTLRRL